jgi:glutaredoxin
MKKLFISLASLLFFLFACDTTFASEKVNVYFFYGYGCPHCAKETSFLESLKTEYPDVNIRSFEVYFHKENVEIMKRAAKKLNKEVTAVPFTVIGDKSFVGFSEQNTPKELTARIEECLKTRCPDPVSEIAGVSGKNTSEETINSGAEASEKIATATTSSSAQSMFTLPVLGTIDPLHFSLPAITIILGLLDGFNPCAMWTLFFLISLLLGMEDKKRMWILGGSFIAASAFVYFLFMAAWLHIILFIGLVFWLKILIGGIALAGGVHSIKEFFTNISGTCTVGDEEQKEKVFGKLKNAVEQKNFWLALGGIILLAFAVNLIELVCSAGLPAIFTQILALNQLSFWQYYFYIGLYILFFMLDDLFVFIVSMTALQMTGITTKYSRFSKLIGGTLMIIIGLLLLFKPEWLMFG